MKKITSLMAVIAMAVMSFTLVSCDDDDYIADTLWGVWEGLRTIMATFTTLTKRK